MILFICSSDCERHIWTAPFSIILISNVTPDGQLYVYFVAFWSLLLYFYLDDDDQSNQGCNSIEIWNSRLELGRMLRQGLRTCLGRRRIGRWLRRGLRPFLKCLLNCTPGHRPRRLGHLELCQAVNHYFRDNMIVLTSKIYTSLRIVYDLTSFYNSTLKVKTKHLK